MRNLGVIESTVVAELWFCNVCSVHVGAVVSGLRVSLREERARGLAVNIAFHWHRAVDSHEGLRCVVYCS